MAGWHAKAVDVEELPTMKGGICFVQAIKSTALRSGLGKREEEGCG
jgi:hypothetical protein